MDSIENAKMRDMLLNSANVKCDCGNVIFMPGFVFKRVSKLVSPSGKDETVPIDVMICTKCGKILDMYESKDSYNRILGLNTDGTPLKEKSPLEV